ncbi:MAG: tetratricopeptide repeat protein [Thermoguttaceae bacterium]
MREDPENKPAAASPSPRRILPCWKKLVFAMVATLGMLLSLEILLALIGIRPVLYQQDPYVGFTTQIPLFVRQRDPSGRGRMVTAANKVRLFNLQSFPAAKPANSYRVFCMGGSTTYGRPYDDTTSFCGWLREFLPKVDPSRNWELVNAGGISYASYRVATLMEELIRYEPDLFVVYTGQNEFLEKRTYQGLIETPSGLRELGALASHTRTYAAMDCVYRTMIRQAGSCEGKRAILDAEVDAILDESIGPKGYHRDDTLRQQVLDHYRYNLGRIVEIARSAGAEVVFVTPASNLLDCSPFKSEHRSGLGLPERSRWDALFQDAEKAIRQARWDDAVTALDEAATIDDRYAHLHYFRGRALYQLGRYAEAKAALIRARDEDVCPLRALSPMPGIVGQVAADRGVPVVDFAAVVDQRSPHGIPGENLFLDHVHPTIEGNRLLARQILDELIRTGRVRPAATWGEAAADEVAARVEGALDLSVHAKALRNLSKCLAWGGKFDEARRLAEKAAAMNPQDSAAYFQLGLCAQGEGRLAEAADHYRKAIAVHPGNVEAHNNLGSVLEQLGQLSEARHHFLQAIALHADDDKAHFNLAGVLLKQGEVDSAAEHFRRVAELRPLDAQAHAALASALVRLRRNAEASEALEKAVKLEPRDPDLHNKLGSLKAAEGDYAGAKRSYLRALELEADHAGAQENLAWLLATAKDGTARDGPEAVRLARSAYNGNRAEDPATLDVLGAAQAETGQFQEASATARRAHQLAVAQGQAGLAEAIAQRLTLYENGRPCRQ